ncbi:MAG: SusC/RagA family TonB-linked outer membrane protein, partial [Mucilaginibacter sp.]|nr:SusC/RagA family TonB-linked outer membrane protein [Mucilaginibacter sp.]
MRNFTFLFKRRWILLLLVQLLISVGLKAQQQTTVSGVVTGTGGETIPGVSVKVKGTSTGGQTDVNGHYSINITGSATLVFSYIGYNPKEESTDGRTKIDVQLTPSEKVL